MLLIIDYQSIVPTLLKVQTPRVRTHVAGCVVHSDSDFGMSDAVF